jgi:hypothetical protein
MHAGWIQKENAFLHFNKVSLLLCHHSTYFIEEDFNKLVKPLLLVKIQKIKESPSGIQTKNE